MFIVVILAFYKQIRYISLLYRCSDCKRLEPKYESAASILGAKKKFVLAKVSFIFSIIVPRHDKKIAILFVIS